MNRIERIRLATAFACWSVPTAASIALAYAEVALGVPSVGWTYAVVGAIVSGVFPAAAVASSYPGAALQIDKPQINARVKASSVLLAAGCVIAVAGSIVAGDFRVIWLAVPLLAGVPPLMAIIALSFVQNRRT